MTAKKAKKPKKTRSEDNLNHDERIALLRMCITTSNDPQPMYEALVEMFVTISPMNAQFMKHMLQPALNIARRS